MKTTFLKLSASIIFCCAITALQAQNIAINLTGTPSSQQSAILDLSQNANLGFLLPNVDLTNVTSINPFTSTPQDGMMVWNTNTPTNTTGGFGAGFYYWQGSQWNFVSPGSSIINSLSVTSPVVNTGTSTSPVLGLSTPLAVNFGGTGLSTAPANGQLLIGNGAGYALNTLTSGTGISITNASGSITINSTGTTTITANPPAYITGTSTAPILNIQGTAGDKGGVLYSTGAGTSAAFNSPGTAAGQILYYNSTGIPGWTTSTYPTGAITINSLLYASAANTLTPLAPGTNNQVLYSNSGVPTWGSLATSGLVSGSGITNYLARWTSSSALATGVAQDNAIGVSISSSVMTPVNMLDVNGAVALGSYAGANVASTNGMISSGSVGIGNNSPNPSAILDLTNSNTTNKAGFLFPSVAVPANIVSPANGLMVFNTTTNCLQTYLGGLWQNVVCQCNGAPTTPGAISGSPSICAFNTATYSIAPITGATNYIWSVPPGAAFTGQGTTTITVTYGGATTGNITVNAQNACGLSGASTLAITVNSSPQTPGISGSTTGCISTSGNAYTCSTVVGATSYIWSISGAGNSISGTTTSASVTFGSTTGTYTISVMASNGSCSSPAATFTVTVYGTLAGTPTITPGCTSSGGVIDDAAETYTCATVTGATTYAWSVNNTYATVTASSTTTATITPASSPGSYTISVAASDPCYTVTATYTVTTIAHGTNSSFSAGTISSWVVPCGVTQITITATGGAGGSGQNTTTPVAGGNGATITGTFTVTSGTTLQVATGSQGGIDNSDDGGGGGGGSFVWNAANTSTPLIIAGGGGGGGYITGDFGGAGSTTTTPTTGTGPADAAAGTGEGGGGGALGTYGAAGGAGYLGNGTNGYSPSTGGNDQANGFAQVAGFDAGCVGGFGGGGGGGDYGGGGGGGYNGGGGGGDPDTGGAGGGSFCSGTQTGTAQTNTGNGSVSITY